MLEAAATHHGELYKSPISHPERFGSPATSALHTAGTRYPPTNSSMASPPPNASSSGHTPTTPTTVSIACASSPPPTATAPPASADDSAGLTPEAEARLDQMARQTEKHVEAKFFRRRLAIARFKVYITKHIVKAERHNKIDRLPELGKEREAMRLKRIRQTSSGEDVLNQDAAEGGMGGEDDGHAS